MSETPPTASKRDAKIFINYRREDASGYAVHLYKCLSERFGPDRVFMDIRAIRPGFDFVNVIETEVAACGAVLVVIGREWLNCAAAGRRRLDDPHDFVRLEIASALRRNVVVVPVLVEGAAMPREQDLPDDLKPLARRQALEVSDTRLDFDVGRLLDALEGSLAAGPGEGAARPARRAERGRFGLGRYWQMFPVRLVAVLAVLAAVLAPQLYLASRPEPFELEDGGRFSTVAARLGRDELTIEAPLTNSEEGLLLSHIANPGENVDLDFDRARLDVETVKKLGASNPPTTPTRITYQREELSAGGQGEPCRTAVNVSLANPDKPPAALHLYQLGAPGANLSRDLEMKAAGGELLVSVITSPADEGDGTAVCRKRLTVEPEAPYPASGAHSITLVASEGAAFRFSFSPATPRNSLWDGADGLFQPFDLGVEKINPEDPAPFRARAVDVRPLGGQPGSPPPAFSARGADGGALLVGGLKVGSDRIQLNVSGRALVKINGRDHVDLLERVKRHPLPALLLAAADAALLVWFLRLLFGRRRPAMR